MATYRNMNPGDDLFEKVRRYISGLGYYSKPSGGIPASDIASGVIPTVPTISTDISSDATSDTKTTSPKAVKTFVEGKGYLTSETYTGTVTGVTMNSGSTISPDANGVVDLGTVITDISSKQNVIDSSHKLSADLIEDGTTNKVINVKPNWNASSGDAAEILNKPTIPTVPTNVSAFTNDAGYTTNTGTVTSTGGEVTVNNIQVVTALPPSPDANTLYLIRES